MTVVVAIELVRAGAVGRVEVQLTVVVEIDPVGLTADPLGDGQVDLGGDLHEFFAAVVLPDIGAVLARNDRHHVRSAQQIDKAVAVEITPAEAADFIPPGRQTQLTADIGEDTVVVAIETDRAALKRDGEIQIAVIVEVGPGGRQRAGHAEGLGLDGGEGRLLRLNRRRRQHHRGQEGRAVPAPVPHTITTHRPVPPWILAGANAVRSSTFASI
ncbi:hypothetical protein D3C87_1204530 [compost metagenome]